MVTYHTHSSVYGVRQLQIRCFSYWLPFSTQPPPLTPISWWDESEMKIRVLRRLDNPFGVWVLSHQLNEYVAVYIQQYSSRVVKKHWCRNLNLLPVRQKMVLKISNTTKSVCNPNAYVQGRLGTWWLRVDSPTSQWAATWNLSPLRSSSVWSKRFQ